MLAQFKTVDLHFVESEQFALTWTILTDMVVKVGRKYELESAALYY